jgi:tetratricopeptide (TPR) repeat protein
MTVSATPANNSGRAAPWRCASAAGVVVVGALLQAHKDGGLAPLAQRSPHLFSHLRARLLKPVIASLGAWQAPDASQRAWAVVWPWALAQLRPDGLAFDTPITPQSWLDRTSWRPFLVLMCHFGFTSVPAFPERYRRRADESAVDNLCGLWSIGASSYYRYLEKGKRQLVQRLVQRPWDAPQWASLRRQAQEAVLSEQGVLDGQALHAWHRQQAQRAVSERDLVSGAWHWLRAQALDELLALIDAHSAEFAASPETDGLMLGIDGAPLARGQRTEALLLQAAIWRARNQPGRELECLEQARRTVAQPPDELMLGLVHAALGKHFEVRDTERSLACYEAGAEHLGRAIAAAGAEVPVKAGDGYVRTLVGMGWHHALKKDPRALALLERAQQSLRALPTSPAAAGLLEQALGEYWRRAGDAQRALGHKLRALNVFEGLDDRAQMLSTYNNLSLLYCETQEFARACDAAQRVIDLARSAPVDAYLLASSYGNLGIALMGLNDPDRAIDAYRTGLALGEQAGLQTLVGRALYNLAEAHYRRFQLRHDIQDEREGDACAAAAVKVWAVQKDKAAEGATRQLKHEVLGPRAASTEVDRLVHEEAVAHFDEWRDVQRARALLALPASPQTQVQAHLAIAEAYLRVANKEREMARALMAKHGLADSYAGAIERLHHTFHHEQSVHERLLLRWQDVAPELLQSERRAAVLGELLRAGHIGKSGYAQLAQVALATASKHLGLLAERGLLMQTGKGPATRYALVETTVSSGDGSVQGERPT